jgi:hypothetical protein
MSGPQIIILAEYPTPEIVETHLRRAHHMRAVAYARWLRSIRLGVQRLFAARPRVAVKRPQPRLTLPRVTASR